MTPQQADAALLRLRVELYTAAQMLKGEQLAEFKELIGEISTILDLGRPHASTAP